MADIANVISLARRAGKILIGYDKIRACKVKADLVVIASDASERTKIHSAAYAQNDNVLHINMTMSQLASYFGSERVAVFAVTESGLAKMIKQAFEDFDKSVQ